MVTTGICVQVYSSNTQIENKLLSNGFTLIDSYTELDNYNTHLSRLEAKNSSYGDLMHNTILLRTIKGANYEKHFMIFKEKTLNSDGEVIKEEKISTQVESMEQTKRIFSASGMYNWCRLIVHEKEYAKGNLVVNIQTVPDLGTFMEISENNTVLQGFSDTKFKQLTYIANSLGLDLGTNYSCKKNFMKYKKSLTIGHL